MKRPRTALHSRQTTSHLLAEGLKATEGSTPTLEMLRADPARLPSSRKNWPCDPHTTRNFSLNGL